MDLSDVFVFTEPQQGASYDDLLAVAKRAEQLGYGGFFRSDHYLRMGGFDGLPGPSDALTTLAGLARDTTRIRLGTLVCSATFRHAGILGIQAAQIDQMSGGRLELGLGAGWFDQEHAAHAIPFPPLGARFDLLEDHLAVITGMWKTPVGELFNYSGRTLSIKDSPAMPKPVQQPGVPIIVGGGGTKRTPRLAARYATEFNRAFSSLEDFTAQCGRVREACRAIDRDPATLRTTIALIGVVGSDESSFIRRAGVVRREPAELRLNGACGLPHEAAAQMRRFREAGAQRIYLQILDLHDLDHLDLIARDVVPLV